MGWQLVTNDTGHSDRFAITDGLLCQDHYKRGHLPEWNPLLYHRSNIEPATARFLHINSLL